MDKILTIIIPTYNMEKYLRHCLDSLIVPNMDKVEVLVINDGSKDSSSAYTASSSMADASSKVVSSETTTSMTPSS